MVCKPCFSVLGGIYCSIYEGLYLLYYEETEANKSAIILLSPLLVWFLIATFRERYKYSIKESPLVDSMLQLAKLVPSGLMGLFLFRPVVSGFIVMTNSIIPINQKNLVLEGTISGIVQTVSNRLDNFEIHIDNGRGRILELDTNKSETEKYVVGENFRLEIKRGFWGLFYKSK
jgi:hypothetical protein